MLQLYKSSLAHRSPFLIRAASTRVPPKGLSAILQKNPDDVVITYAKRTAIGKAKKGQLKDAPVDEILLALFKVDSALTSWKATAHWPPEGNLEGDQAWSFKNRWYLRWWDIYLLYSDDTDLSQGLATLRRLSMFLGQLHWLLASLIMSPFQL